MNAARTSDRSMVGRAFGSWGKAALGGLSIVIVLGLLGQTLGGWRTSPSALAGEPTSADQAGSTSPANAASEKNEPKFPNAETELLSIYVGPWNVTQKFFDEMGTETGTFKGTEEIVWVLDHHAILRTYTTTIGDTIFRANGTIAWNTADKKYKGAWFDNQSTAGPSTVVGEWNATDKAMIWSIESSENDGQKRQHKIVEKFVDEERRESTTYRISGSQVIKELEATYKRTVPCPGKIRTIIRG